MHAQSWREAGLLQHVAACDLPALLHEAKACAGPSATNRVVQRSCVMHGGAQREALLRNEQPSAEEKQDAADHHRSGMLVFLVAFMC